jgi:hypothetical protein
MAIRETMQMPRQQHRQQVRGFALVWTGLSLLIGAATFIAIYAGTGILSNNRLAPPPAPMNMAAPAVVGLTAAPTLGAIASDTPISAPQTKDIPAAIALQVTATPVAGFVATLPPTQPAASIPATQAAAPVGTISPMKDDKFDLGIAVQENPDANTYKNWVEMAGSQLKLNWVKEQVVWRDMEPIKGKYDFATLDSSLPQLSKAGIRVLLSVAKAPIWARDKGAITNKPGQYDGPPANPQDLADFLTVMIKKYPGMIHAVEVWNEPNLDREWATAPKALDAGRYVTLLKTAHDAIKVVDPNIIVISAALSPTGANIAGAAMDDFNYFKMMVDAGVLRYADCVGAHHNGINVPPTADYSAIPNRPNVRFRGPWANPHHSWAFKSTLEGYNKMVTAAGSTLKLCITEFGWPSTQDLKGQPRAGFEFAADNSLAEQADYIMQAIDMMQKWGWVRLAFLFNLNYGAQAGWSMSGPVSDNVVYSILGPNFQPRPVWQRIVDRNFRAVPRGR